MIHREPDKRLEAEDYLKQQRGNAFPEIFYTFLQPYMAQFAKETFLSADERILVIPLIFPSIRVFSRESVL